MTMFRFLFCAHNPHAIGQRWQHIAVWYLIGYLICIAQSGIPHWHYLIPFKLTALFFGWCLGTASYLRITRKKSQINVIEDFGLAVKFFLSGILIALVSLIPLKIISLLFGIPMTVFML